MYLKMYSTVQYSVYVHVQCTVHNVYVHVFEVCTMYMYMYLKCVMMYSTIQCICTVHHYFFCNMGVVNKQDFTVRFSQKNSDLDIPET